MKQEKSGKRITFDITNEDFELMTKYQLKKIKETGDKPTYNEIVQEVSGFDINNFREKLKQIVEDLK